MTKFCSLFSGSSGNCTYIESGGSAILIDAGCSARATVRALAEIGSDISKISAIFVTHEHSDHIKGLAVLISKYGLRVYANRGTMQGILKYSMKINESMICAFDTGQKMDCETMSVSSFATSHDSNESVGYRIHTSDGRKLAVATDLGFVSETVMKQISGCDLVMLESNHDLDMLRSGSYPYFLKRRILSDNGHLSNDDCSAVLPALAESGTTRFILAHLSHDNNRPDLAENEAVAALAGCGISRNEYELEAAPRFEHSGIYEI